MNNELLDEIVRRIVDVAWAEKIVFFGSDALGEAGPRSDLDLLVVWGVTRVPSSNRGS